MKTKKDMQLTISELDELRTMTFTEKKNAESIVKMGTNIYHTGWVKKLNELQLLYDKLIYLSLNNTK